MRCHCTASVVSCTSTVFLPFALALQDSSSIAFHKRFGVVQRSCKDPLYAKMSDHGHGEPEDAGCGVPAAPGAPSSSYALLSISNATAIILKTANRLQPVTVSLDKALGTILAEDVRAPEPLPPFPASIKVGRLILFPVKALRL